MAKMLGRTDGWNQCWCRDCRPTKSEHRLRVRGLKAREKREWKREVMSVINVEYDEHVYVHDGEEWTVYRGDTWLASFALPEDAEEYAERKRLEP